MTINSIDLNYTSLAILQETSQSQGVSALTSLGTDANGSGTIQQTSTVGGDSATISGPGQLFSQLQQLQSQDPTTFQQLAANIATQLQTAAQQSTGTQSDFLTNLASRFQTAANTGDLSSLQPTAHAHHGHRPEGTYNQQGLVVSPTPPLDGGTSATNGVSASGATSLGQLFANIAQEVAQAVGT